ncbi:unnamed protein product [Soboliphyme baturini]|uniref:Secreted protein n=1 Tax=Soboliphyme baturini TaxID=241478 RepID=A0A183IK60_9BILA|nr:unnamed protein product [Soboliphyme baturini]
MVSIADPQTFSFLYRILCWLNHCHAAPGEGFAFQQSIFGHVGVRFAFRRESRIGSNFIPVNYAMKAEAETARFHSDSSSAKLWSHTSKKARRQRKATFFAPSFFYQSDCENLNINGMVKSVGVDANGF